MMLQQEQPQDFVIATGVQYSVRDFVNATAQELGMELRWEGEGLNEKAYWVNPPNLTSNSLSPNTPIIAVDPRYFRPTEVETLLGDPAKAKIELSWVPEITLQQMVEEMVAYDLDQAKRHALLQNHGYDLALTKE